MYGLKLSHVLLTFGGIVGGYWFGGFSERFAEVERMLFKSDKAEIQAKSGGIDKNKVGSNMIFAFYESLGKKFNRNGGISGPRNIFFITLFIWLIYTVMK